VSRFILDTDHLTLLQHLTPAVVQRVAATPPDDLAITIVTVEEQLRGWLAVVRQHSGSERQTWAYRGLHDALISFNQIIILDFDQAAFRRYAALRQQRLRIGSQDLRIAASVLSVNGTLVTRNRRDFAQIPDLALEDWSLA
jgi:tRNA(fMet)-specific endonuclease VapC